MSDKANDMSQLLKETVGKLQTACRNIEVLQKDMDGVIRDVTSQENLKADKQTMQHSLSELKAVDKQLHTQICLKENQIVTIENFIEKYLPMRVLT